VIAYATSQDSTLRAGPLIKIPGLLRDLGCEPEPVLKRAGFSPDALAHPERRVSYLMASRLLADCVEVTGCEHFGLLLGRRAGPSHLGLAGFLVRAASTVRQALEALVGNLDLHDDGGNSTLDCDGEFCQLSYRIIQPGAAAVEQIYDLCAVEMCNIMRSLCGEKWNASGVLLPRRQPRDPTPYTRFFRTVVFYDADTCSVLFPSHVLDTESPTADELLFAHLDEEARFLHQARQQNIVDSLPAVMQRGLLLNRFTARDIAEAFGMHERTLHRRLQSAGTSFRRELDSVREFLSTQLLESTNLPVCDVATSIGYADSSTFIRAFRRWTGHNPSKWRQRNQLH